MSASSRTESSLAKAETITDGGSTFVITYLRVGCARVETCGAAAGERSEAMWEKTLCEDTKAYEGEWKGDLNSKAKISLKPIVTNMVNQDIPLEPIEVSSRIGIHLQPMKEPALEQMCAPDKGCDSIGSLWQRRLLAGPMGPWSEDTMLQQVCWEDLQSWGDPYWSTLFLKDCTSWKGLTLVQRIVVCGMDSPTEAEEWGALCFRRKGHQRQRMRNWLQIPFPTPFCRGGREIRSKVKS